MKVCFPLKEVSGLDSEVYEHFGSAPAFIFVDTEIEDIEVMKNPDHDHIKGMCDPLEKLEGHEIEGLVVRGIGSGALKKLNQAGITVYKAEAHTVREILDLLRKGQLPEFPAEQGCAGHNEDCV